MLAGRPYDPGDGELVALRRVAQGLMRDYNATIIGDKTRARTLTQLLGSWNGVECRRPFTSITARTSISGPVASSTTAAFSWTSAKSASARAASSAPPCSC
ncbi:maltose acetyltransferase domain-containing protein [Paracoccus mutanolyticus]|uniref:maltose acetyltransferase domain-containing protein n=1 Tax=Paracoccus mutanolyticus TaxID=1499308 RepID=UPI002950063C|nr:maltose acetyltransferase domain-containing protein [Paracoccus mutanolyticus]